MSTDQSTPTTAVTRARTANDAGFVQRLIALSLQGLPQMYRPDRHSFAQTVRRGSEGLKAEGENLRYAAIAALGLARVDAERQRTVLGDATAAEFTGDLAIRSIGAPDLGAAALTAWAAVELTGTVPDALLQRLASAARGRAPEPTVDYAWMLTALVAARELGDVRDAAAWAVERLLAAQGESGIFPHALPAASLGRFRAHVGCFADQVYPIQALARYHAAFGDPRALESADRCAARIVELQGTAGQWWWHYDVRTGKVVEGYPVYSVHQHAMAPMALFDLHDAGGHDHRGAVSTGLNWLRRHPECSAELIDDRRGVVWRKVGRREPRKALRSLRAVSTSLHPTLRFGLLDRMFPPGPIDYECRPYELGWLLYAWLEGPANTP